MGRKGNLRNNAIHYQKRNPSLLKFFPVSEQEPSVASMPALPDVSDSRHRALVHNLRCYKLGSAILTVLGLPWSEFLGIPEVTDAHLLFTPCTIPN